jgi:hypothetical protein
MYCVFDKKKGGYGKEIYPDKYIKKGLISYGYFSWQMSFSICSFD